VGLDIAVREHAVFSREVVALVDGDESLTYRELWGRVLRLANELRSLGVRSGDRVAILSYNSIRYYEWYLACCHGGFIGVPLNLRWTPGELAHFVRYTRPSAIIVDGRAGELAAALLEVAGIERVIGYGRDYGVVPGAVDLEDSLRAASEDDGPDPPRDGPVLIAPTSGTTGVMKGAVLTPDNTFLSCLSWMGGYRLTPRSQWLQSLPMYFAQGAPGHYLPLVVGATMHIVPAFDPTVCTRLVAERNITHTIWPPAMMYQLLAAGAGPEPFESLEVISTGGSPFDEAKLRAALSRFGPRIFPTYGLTEATASVTQLRPDEYATAAGALIGERYTSIGKPWPGVRLRVLRDDGSDVERDGTDLGEIVVAGRSVCQGYWEMPEETRETFRDGWLFTGDLATIDESGFVYIVDRRKDIVVSGGINVATLEVERVLSTFPGVAGVAVVGIPDDELGEAVHAVVVKAPGADFQEGDVVQWCRDRLASYKKPRSVEFVDQIPLSSTGKVLKRELRERYWAGRSRRVG
jgi:long-chain acyl-CoA synthetase